MSINKIASGLALGIVLVFVFLGVFWLNIQFIKFAANSDDKQIYYHIKIENVEAGESREIFDTQISVVTPKTILYRVDTDNGEVFVMEDIKEGEIFVISPYSFKKEEK